MNVKSTTIYLLALTLLSSCVAVKSKYHRDLLHKSIVGSSIFNSHFIGFALYDPVNDKYLYELNIDKYFTPSSNTKLLTFYTGLQMLGDSIPALQYQIDGDSIFFTGTGDPTFLHWAFPDQPVYDFLNDPTKKLIYVKTAFQDESLGLGWSWEAYEYYYQVERSGFPIYGNTVGFIYDSINDSFAVSPKFFDGFTEIRSVDQPRTQSNRQHDYNIFSFAPDTARSNYKNRIPFKPSSELLIALLEDTLNVSVTYLDTMTWTKRQTLYSRTTFELYSYMLKISDSFCAEQIHYLCTSANNLDMNGKLSRDYIMDHFFESKGLHPIWIDGSGLSGYNLMTPRFMIQLLQLISEEMPLITFKQMLAIGGVDGTLQKWYAAPVGEQPYVFAKTGTHRNNHSLTGIISTKSGKDLFFSFMNNNFPTGTTPVKQEMQKTLRLIYERF